MDQRVSTLPGLLYGALGKYTFSSCGGRAPATMTESLDLTELGDIARIIDATFLETTRLFAWATGATTQIELTDESIALFADRLGQVSCRFGTTAAHFSLDVEDAIAQSAADEFVPRRSATMRRHRNRLRRIRDYPVPRFENRLNQPSSSISLTGDEVACVAGFDAAAVVILVEHFGVIVDGCAILTRERIMAKDRPAISAKDVIAAAESALGLLHSRGRAFVAIRHENNRVRPILGFFEKIEL